MGKKRKAVSCLLVEENNNTGYHKYILYIQQEDGTIKTGVPAYGENMGDAIKRLVKHERADKLTKVYVERIEPITMIVIIIAWVTCIMISAISDNYRYALWAVIGIFSVFTTLALIKFFKNISN